MARVTQQAAICAFFDQHNLLKRDDTARSKKYIVYRNLHSGENWYVGKAGAVRRGNTVSASVPLGENLRKGYIIQGKKILESASMAR